MYLDTRVRGRPEYTHVSGYIFDVEGTLVDSVPSNFGASRKLSKRPGLSIPFATLQLYSGLDGDQTLQIIAPDMSETQRKQIVVAHAGSMKPNTFTASKHSRACARCSKC